MRSIVLYKMTVAILVLFACFQFNLMAQEAGPDFIKRILENDSVFDTPTYNFTSDYDAYKGYENIKGLFIDGVDYEGHPTKVFCWYGIPANLQAGEKAPAVVVVHGGGGTAFPGWVDQWTSRGYIAIAIAHEGQLPGEKVNGWYQTWAFSGPRRAGFYRDADKDVHEQWFYHAIADAMLANSLLRSFPEVDTTNIGINGISWGGVLTNVIAGLDHRFKFAIPVYGCGYLYDSPKYSVDMAANTPAEEAFYRANWDPSLYIPLQNCPLFYVNGNNDKQFAMNIATRSFKAMPSEKYLRIEHKMRHSTVFGYAPQEIYHFADYITKNGHKPLSVSIDSVMGKSVFASFEGVAKSAVLFYTLDTGTWVQDEYEWLQMDLELNAETAQMMAVLPDYTQCFYINVVTDEDYMYSSTMEKSNLPPAPKPVVPPTSVAAIKATANTNYGIDQVATLFSDVLLAADSLATFQISCDIAPGAGQAIMSGSGGGTSVASDWGVASTTDLSDIQNVIFTGLDNEWVKVSNIRIVNFNANGGGLTVDNITSISFQSIVIVNGQSGNKDAVALEINGNSTDVSSSITLTHDTIDFTEFTDMTPLSSFSIGTGVSPNQDKNKWSVESIMVQFSMEPITSKNPMRHTNKKRLVISPNPSYKEVSFNVDAKSAYFYNMAGKCVMTDLAGIETIDISNLNPGVFLVKVLTSEGNSFHGKLLK